MRQARSYSGACDGSTYVFYGEAPPKPEEAHIYKKKINQNIIRLHFDLVYDTFFFSSFLLVE